MEDQNLKRFSWTSFFFVTSLSFFLFLLIIKELEGKEPRIFIWTGVTTLILGLASLLLGRPGSAETDN